MENVTDFAEQVKLLCSEHSAFKKGCALCKLALACTRAVTNAIRYDGKVKRTANAEKRDRLERKLLLVEEKGLRWKPEWSRCKCAHKCRCAMLFQSRFDTQEEREAFTANIKAQLAEVP